MYNNSFHQLLCCTRQPSRPLAQPALLSEQTSKHRCVSSPLDPGTAALLSEQTSKQGGGPVPARPGTAAHTRRQNRQASTHRYVLRTSSGPGTAGLLSEQTSKQLSTGYSQFLGKLSTAFAHDSSSTAQEPWSPVHIGSVFSPWTTNDSTWDA